jgi:hypothetical protein
MNEEQLISALRRRAEDHTKRTDYVDSGCPDLGTPATPDVDRAQRAMGFVLHPLHRRLLEEVANGGFGPGDGLIGLPGGRLDDDGHSLPDVRDKLGLDAYTPLPTPVVPLCEWGDGIWSCLDEETGAILTMDEHGPIDTGRLFWSWLEDWVLGVSIWEKMFVFEEKEFVNPLTKRSVMVRLPSRPIGTPYVARRIESCVVLSTPE